MRKAIILLFLCIPFAVNAATYYVSPTGSDAATGTITTPWKSWNYAFNKLVAGDILYIRGGTYTTMAPASGTHRYGVYVSGKNGTSSNHITVSNYQSEVPILDGSSWTITTGSIIGIRMNNCSYWDITGLTVTNFRQYSDNAYNSPGWWTENCSYMNYNRCTGHDNGDGYEMIGSANYLYYTNCDSYQNHDRFIGAGGEKPGGLSNGWHGGLPAGSHVFFTGCRSWSNSDDGWDLFGSSGFVVWKDCWAFSNADGYGGVTGDGSGFKIGPITTAETGDQRVLYNCLAFDNACTSGAGFDQNQSSAPYVPKKLYNCTAYANHGINYQFYTNSGSIIKNCISLSGEGSDQFGNSTVDHNSWQNGLVATSADFLSMNGAELKQPRKADGSLPDVNFLHLATGSDLIDKGVNVGLPFAGTAPDLGAFEQKSSTSSVVMPVYKSAVVENATPSILAMTYDVNLNNLVVPPISSFIVLVNSSTRTINAVVISGNTVQLTLASAIKYGDNITLSYTKPASNPLQTVTGGMAASISAQKITNSIGAPTANGANPIITMTINPNPVHRFTNILFAYGSTFSKDDPAASPQLIRIMDLSGKLFVEKLLVTGVESIRFPINLRSGVYIVMVLLGGQDISSQKLIVYR